MVRNLHKVAKLRVKSPFLNFRPETAEKSINNQRQGILAFDLEDAFSE
jgi:hypothetical protein